MSSKASDGKNRQSTRQELNRREFLQKTGLVVGALSLAELSTNLGITSKAKAYTQALADTNGRKLALLVGRCRSC